MYPLQPLLSCHVHNTCTINEWEARADLFVLLHALIYHMYLVLREIFLLYKQQTSCFFTLASHIQGKSCNQLVFYVGTSVNWEGQGSLLCLPEYIPICNIWHNVYACVLLGWLRQPTCMFEIETVIQCFALHKSLFYCAYRLVFNFEPNMYFSMLKRKLDTPGNV